MGGAKARASGHGGWYRLALRCYCHGGCVFCRPSRPDEPTPFDEAERRLVENFQPGARLTIGGEEPTTHPDLPRIVQRAKEIGYESVTLQTTGESFAQPGFARLMKGLGLDRVYTPIYGPTAASHEAATRHPGSFARMARGVLRLRRAGVEVLLHTIVMRHNVALLPDLVQLCREKLVPLARFEQLQPERNYDYAAHAVPLRDVAEAVVRIPAESLAGIEIVNFPACFVRLLAERAPERRFPRVEDVPGTPQRSKSHAAACAACAQRDACSGPYEGYIAVFGDGDLRPT